MEPMNTRPFEDAARNQNHATGYQADLQELAMAIQGRLFPLEDIFTLKPGTPYYWLIERVKMVIDIEEMFPEVKQALRDKAAGILRDTLGIKTPEFVSTGNAVEDASLKRLLARKAKEDEEELERIRSFRHASLHPQVPAPGSAVRGSFVPGSNW